MRRDSVGYTMMVAAVLCIVCSVLVSGAAVGLRSRQQANKDAFRKENILIAAGMLEKNQSVEELFEARIQEQLIDLATGTPASPDAVPAPYDQRSAARDPDLSVGIDAAQDVAGIKRREKYSQVYLVRQENGELEKIVLPVYGKGLWSTLRGFLALEADLNTVAGLTFYEHKETPGLGGEIDNPLWKAKWPGKLLRDSEGAIQLEVIKGQVQAGTPRAQHQIDGLSGATITSRGVSNLIRYWLSDNAFGPFLDQIAKGNLGESDG
ncbi:MAG: Na(+)-translocating NADH-quinone reductase subunit C [Pirellulaceae bacterium]|nr:Na(+)-translocating NADH-quinone reductase subunit C [Pirellulaceae bacterium]